ncbi:hypothetical protein CASFOL_000794 [Castilleja foliolosa]|uniref:KIB1-4 beta-propeller domain-containing protein n=1 Tax=Castilleja foliolosa TaxID=1961234 RepID=A0ABD3EL08_9LAMI
MASFVKRCWPTGFSLLRRISTGSRNFADKKLGPQMMMMSRGVNSSSSPWLLLPPVFQEDGGDMVYKFYNLSEDKEESFPRNSEEKLVDDDAKVVGSSHGYLALFNQRNNNHLFLYNPINLTPDGRGSVSKLILSSSPDDDDDECIALMIFGPERRLAFCNPCRSTEWTPIGELYCYVKNKGIFRRSYVDIVYSSTQKLFFCQTNNGPLECWDLADSLSPRVWEFRGTNYWWRFLKHTSAAITRVNLVYAEEYNQLFVVTRYVFERMESDGTLGYPIYFGKYRGWDNSSPYRTIWLDAYRIDFGVEKSQLLEGSLDGLAMFIGINHSIAISPTLQLKLTSNCIYYTDTNSVPIPPNAFYGGHDIGIYDYTNRTISPCYYFPFDVEGIKRIMPAPLWFTPCHQ